MWWFLTIFLETSFIAVFTNMVDVNACLMLSLGPNLAGNTDNAVLTVLCKTKQQMLDFYTSFFLLFLNLN